ncbi:MAG: hypothetical protein M5U33_05840 [Pseudorhodoplanes sp.]|nr:hypothetical protein [Pseudorhodoplanes sp.]
MVAVSAGALAFLIALFDKSSVPVMAVGAVLFAIGLWLTLARLQQWELLAQICIVTGALMLAGAILYADDGSLRAAIGVTIGLAAAAVLARSSLLAALAVISLAGCLGARTGYVHAMYSLSIREPAVTIALFGALALAAFRLSHRFSADYERLLVTVSRVSVFLVNFGFWIGSLWGDRLILVRRIVAAGALPPEGGLMRMAPVIPAYVFSIGWALALVAVGVWGVRANRRWVVNVAAVFGAIHFYTQWFQRARRQRALRAARRRPDAGLRARALALQQGESGGGRRLSGRRPDRLSFGYFLPPIFRATQRCTAWATVTPVRSALRTPAAPPCMARHSAWAWALVIFWANAGLAKAMTPAAHASNIRRI